MGSRTFWEIRTYKDAPSIYLYSHWGGGDKWATTANALREAEPRWTDATYGARIFISQIIGNQWGEETGFGITAGPSDESPFEESYFSVVVDFSTGSVTYNGIEVTFQEFLDSEDETESVLNEVFGSEDD